MSATGKQTITKGGRGRKRKEIATDAERVLTTTGLPESQVGVVDEAAREDWDDPVVHDATELPPAGVSDSSAPDLSSQVGSGNGTESTSIDRAGTEQRDYDDVCERPNTQIQNVARSGAGESEASPTTKSLVTFINEQVQGTYRSTWDAHLAIGRHLFEVVYHGSEASYRIRSRNKDQSLRRLEDAGSELSASSLCECVKLYLGLPSLPAVVREHLSVTHALHLLRTDLEDKDQLVELAAKGKWSARRLRQEIELREDERLESADEEARARDLADEGGSGNPLPMPRFGGGRRPTYASMRGAGIRPDRIEFYGNAPDTALVDPIFSPKALLEWIEECLERLRLAPNDIRDPLAMTNASATVPFDAIVDQLEEQASTAGWDLDLARQFGVNCDELLRRARILQAWAGRMVKRLSGEVPEKEENDPNNRIKKIEID